MGELADAYSEGRGTRITTRVVILGGGFGGVYAALGFDRLEPGRFGVTLIDRENFFLFTPMLSEVAASSIDTRRIPPSAAPSPGSSYWRPGLG